MRSATGQADATGIATNFRDSRMWSLPFLQGFVVAGLLVKTSGGWRIDRLQASSHPGAAGIAFMSLPARCPATTRPLIERCDWAGVHAGKSDHYCVVIDADGK